MTLRFGKHVDLCIHIIDGAIDDATRTDPRMQRLLSALDQLVYNIQVYRTQLDDSVVTTIIRHKDIERKLQKFHTELNACLNLFQIAQNGFISSRLSTEVSGRSVGVQAENDFRETPQQHSAHHQHDPLPILPAILHTVPGDLASTIRRNMPANTGTLFNVFEPAFPEEEIQSNSFTPTTSSSSSNHPSPPSTVPILQTTTIRPQHTHFTIPDTFPERLSNRFPPFSCNPSSSSDTNLPFIILHHYPPGVPHLRTNVSGSTLGLNGWDSDDDEMHDN